MSETVFVPLDAMRAIPLPASLEQAYTPQMQQTMDSAFALRRQHFPDEASADDAGPLVCQLVPLTALRAPWYNPPGKCGKTY